jgi:hypothetical protein
MSNSKNVTQTNSTTRDRIAMFLMLLAALGALYALISAVGVALSAGPETQQVEWWRAFGFVVFTVLFVLLAFWPRRYPGIWELVLLDKAALTLVEVALIGNQAANAASTAVADGILTLLILAAYILSRGYSSWKR